MKSVTCTACERETSDYYLSPPKPLKGPMCKDCYELLLARLTRFDEPVNFGEEQRALQVW
jgi:NAD-dependent SIR2 family protein deacetylase